jgi:hypothetical protein
VQDLQAPAWAAPTPEVHSDPGAGQVDAEVVAGGEVLDSSAALHMSHDSQQQPSAPTASQRAYDSKKKGTSSHDGGFLGFGTEYQPYAYTDPHLNHHKLDPKVKRLGVQQTRIFVPWNVVTTGMLGMAGPDLTKQYIDQVTQSLDADPTNTALQDKLAAAKKEYAQDQLFTESFLKTMKLAGKHTTINLTFLGAVGRPDRVQVMAQILQYFIKQGYRHLETTLENEPNGGNPKGTNYRAAWARAVKAHDKAGMAAAAKNYVDAYHNLQDDLTALGARADVKVVGGDMVAHHRAEFFRAIVQQGLNNYVDAYSLHQYWGSDGHGFGTALENLRQMQHLAARIAPGKSMQITEFGRSRGNAAAPRNVETAFEEGLFALSAINDGYTGVVKWDGFYMGPPTGGDNPGKFYMIGGPQQHYGTDAMYALMRMFTHSVEPGWRAEGTNHGQDSVQCTFRSPDGHDGTILAMSRRGGPISTHGLPGHHGHLYVHVWKNGQLQTTKGAHGGHIEVPALGAVAVSTKPLG